jgi:hypothetical protein
MRKSVSSGAFPLLIRFQKLRRIAMIPLQYLAFWVSLFLSDTKARLHLLGELRCIVVCDEDETNGFCHNSRKFPFGGAIFD